MSPDKYLAVMKKLMVDHPTLNMQGYRTHGNGFQLDRAGLLDPKNAKAFEACLEYFELVSPHFTEPEWCNEFSLRIAERAGLKYVPFGIVYAAALYMGCQIGEGGTKYVNNRKIIPLGMTYASSEHR